MTDGLAWDDLPSDLEGPGVTIRRKDFDGLAMCLIRMEAGGQRDREGSGGQWPVAGTVAAHGPPPHGSSQGSLGHADIAGHRWKI